MEVASQSQHSRILQECIIQIHQKLVRISRKDYIFPEFKSESNNYLDKLLDYLEKELKKYGMYSKFENMSNDYRRKEFIVLLTKQLGVKLDQNEAGEITLYNTNFEKSNIDNKILNIGDYEQEDVKQKITPCIKKSFIKFAKKHNMSEEEKLNHVCIREIYSGILDQIQNELNGLTGMMKDPVTTVLLIGLCVRLQEKRPFCQLTCLPTSQRRRKLLKLLFFKLMRKCKQIALLDRKEMTNKQTNSNLYKQICSNCPNEIWEKIINFGPKGTLMSPLHMMYPTFILEMFLEYLSEAKENIIFEQETIFRAKMFLLRKEGLETVESLKKNLQDKKYIEAFLREYICKLHSNYENTEKAYFRQEILKNEIYGTVMNIKHNIHISNSNLRQIHMEIKEKEKSVHTLYSKLNKLQEMF